MQLRASKAGKALAQTLAGLVRTAPSLLLALALVVQGNLLVGHFHAPDAQTSAAVSVADGESGSSPEPVDRDTEGLDCEICGALSLCRAVSFASAPDPTQAVLAISSALTPPASMPRPAPERTGRSPRAPPFSLV